MLPNTVITVHCAGELAHLKTHNDSGPVLVACRVKSVRLRGTCIVEITDTRARRGLEYGTRISVRTVDVIPRVYVRRDRHYNLRAPEHTNWIWE